MVKGNVTENATGHSTGNVTQKNNSSARDVALILAASFFFMASPMLVTPLITGYSESLGASAALMGIIGGMMNICSLCCRPFVGNLADRVSKYHLAFVGSALLVVACLTYILATSPAVIVAARIVNGVGYSCCTVCLSTWMTNLLPRDRIGSGMGLYGTVNAMAMAVSPAIGVTMYQHLGYHQAFAVSTTSAALTMLIIQFVHDKGLPASKAPAPTATLDAENPAKAPTSSAQASGKASAPSAFDTENASALPAKKNAAPAASAPATTSDGAPQKNRPAIPRIEIIDVKVLPIAIIIMLFAIPYCATQSFLVSYVETRNLAVHVSLFFPFYAVVLFVLRLSLREWFDKKAFSFFLRICSVSALCSISLLAIMKNNLVMFAAATFMAGGYGIMCSVCQSHAMLLADKNNRGLANSTYYVGLDIGMALGPILGGLLYGHVDIAGFYPMLAITLPLILLVDTWHSRKRKQSAA